MKTKITLAVATVCLFLGTNASAQLNVGGGLGYDMYSSVSVSVLSIGINGEYALADESGARLSFFFSLPTSEKEEFSGNAYSSATSPSYITVSGEYKLNIMRFALDYKRYWGDGDYDDGGFYGAIGIGLGLASVSHTLDSYDASLYNVSIGDESSLSQLYIRAHLGYDIKLDAFSIFIEPGIDIAANSVNDQEVDVSIPTFWNISGGIRFPFE